MGKFKRRHTVGFLKNNVPHNKGKPTEKEKNPPAPFTRVDRDTLEVVQNPPFLSEGQEMILRPGCHRLLRPRPISKVEEGGPLDQSTDNR